MYSIDSNYINMTLAVQKIMQKHAKDLEGRKALLNKLAQMNKCLDSIAYHQAEAETGSKGATEAKSNAATEAVSLGMSLAKRATEYAKENGDAVRKAQFKVTRRSLINVQGVVTVSRLTDLLKHLKEVNKELEAFDVTVGEIKTLQQALESFNNQIASPREVTVTRKTHNGMVSSQMSLLRKTMTSMDNLMTKFNGTEFLTEYQNARKVIGLGTRKSKKGKKDDKNKPIDKPED